MDSSTKSSGTDRLPADHRSGFVAIVGRPNAGKSTLLNRCLGRKIAIVTPKPQTTRRRMLGVKTLQTAQILFVDTPGIHRARDLINERMVQAATSCIGDSDVVLWMIDADHGIDEVDREIASMLTAPRPVIVALNKIDRVRKDRLLPLMQEVGLMLPERELIPTSALTGENVTVLLEAIESALPPGPRYYPADEITDQPERVIIEELIREKVILQTRQEIPYSVAVTVDSFEEKPKKNMVVIRATIHVARDSQKPILIGQKGATVKAIGEAARREVEKFLGVRIYLELFVRVQTDWNKQVARLREFGL